MKTNVSIEIVLNYYIERASFKLVIPYFAGVDSFD